MTTDTRIPILSQEQDAQRKDIAALGRKVARLQRQLDQVAQEVATLKAAWVVHCEGAACSGCKSK